MPAAAVPATSKKPRINTDQTWILRKLEAAGKALEEIRSNNRDNSEGVLRAMLTVLLFAEIEVQHPGNMQRLQDQVNKIAKAMKPPEVEA